LTFTPCDIWLARAATRIGDIHSKMPFRPLRRSYWDSAYLLGGLRN
jgi:hypothetical protein